MHNSLFDGRGFAEHQSKISNLGSLSANAHNLEPIWIILFKFCIFFYFVCKNGDEA